MSLEDSSSLCFRGYTSFLLKSPQICFVWPLGGPHSSDNLAYNKVFVLNTVSYGDQSFLSYCDSSQYVIVT